MEPIMTTKIEQRSLYTRIASVPGRTVPSIVAVEEPMFNVARKAMVLCCCLAVAGVAYFMFASTDVAPTGSPVSSAAATEGTRGPAAGTSAPREGAATPSRANLDYFPANYVNQGRDSDGNVMTYEHD
jgi:hypothetical protein